MNLTRKIDTLMNDYDELMDKHHHLKKKTRKFKSLRKKLEKVNIENDKLRKINTNLSNKYEESHLLNIEQ